MLPERVAHGELLSGRLPRSFRCHGVIRTPSLVSPHGIVPAIPHDDLLLSRRFAAYPTTHSLTPFEFRLGGPGDFDGRSVMALA
jgi:hypothetical protein